MQTHDAPAEILFKLWPKLEANKKPLMIGAILILAAAGVGYFLSAQRAQKEIDAGEALTALMLTPAAGGQTPAAFQQLAEKYSGTTAAQRAQLQAAASFFNAGSYPEAQALFQKYLQSNGGGSFAATAQLGIAACLEAQNKLDQAAPAYQRVISAYGDSLAVPTAEFALGRIAQQQGKLAEAVKHFETVARSPMGGSMAQEAMILGSELKAKIPAAAPKPAVTTAPAATPTATPPAATPVAPKPAGKP